MSVNRKNLGMYTAIFICMGIFISSIIAKEISGLIGLILMIYLLYRLLHQLPQKRGFI